MYPRRSVDINLNRTQNEMSYIVEYRNDASHIYIYYNVNIITWIGNVMSERE